MKKLLSRVIFVIILLGMDITSATSQVRLGVKGGVNFNSVGDIDWKSYDASLHNATGFHAGLAFQIKVPVIGLAIQPEILYTNKKSEYTLPNPVYAEAGTTQHIQLNYIEIPIHLQVGLDLILLRPFLQVSPYVGYAIYNNMYDDLIRESIDWNDLNRFQYGIGVGGGIDIWMLQISCRYNWDLGNIMNKDSEAGFMEYLKDGKFKGFEISLAFFF